MGRVVFSQNLEELAKVLIEAIRKESSSFPFLQKKWVLTPNGPIRQWLSLKLGQAQVLAGCKVTSLEGALFPGVFPTHFEWMAAIDADLRKAPPKEVIPFFEGKKELELVDHLATLFSSYLLYGRSFLKEMDGWQASLFERIAPPSLESIGLSEQVHCFGFDFLGADSWEALFRCPHLHIYLFSPCLYFWEDLRSNWERRRLSQFWEKKGASEVTRSELSRYLEEAPSLLANWGKVGRETLKTLDRFLFEGIDAYGDFSESPTLLQSIQKEIALFEPKSPSPLSDDSIACFLTGSSRMNEVEVLREEILSFVSEKKISFSEILILAPDIEPYVPLIELLFSSPEAPIPYRFFETALGKRSSFYQGLLRLSELIQTKWSANGVIALLNTPALFHRFGWTEEERSLFISWTLEIFSFPDWKQGAKQLILDLVMLFPSPLAKGISLGKSETLSTYLSFLETLETDLAPLQSTEYSLQAWAGVWSQLAERYLSVEREDEIESMASDDFQKKMMQLRRMDSDAVYPFSIIGSYLQSPCFGAIHGNHLHGVQIGSIGVGSILPSRAIFLLGMDEHSFPRKKIASSLNLLDSARLRIPENPDIDRYLFLQILFSTSDFLRISYPHLASEDGKEIKASLLVEELLEKLPKEVRSVKIKKRPSFKKKAFFSIAPPSVPPPLREERRISLSELSAFARHPWKYYLEKKEGIFLHSEPQTSFALQRAPLLRASLKWPLESSFQKRSSLPQGLFKDAFLLDLEERASSWKERAGALQGIALLEKIERPKGSLFPPISIPIDEGSILVSGEIQHIGDRGPLHLGDDSLSSLLKAWPELLAGLVVLGKTEILCVKNGKVKTVRDPAKALAGFLRYYLRASSHLSLLLPDWADVVLRKNSSLFEWKTDYEDPVVEWLLPRLEIPPVETLWTQWDWLKDLFSELIDLYPLRKKEEDEAL